MAKVDNIKIDLELRPRITGGADHRSFRDYLTRQHILQRVAYQRDPAMLTCEDRVEFVRWNVLAAIRELTEMLDEVEGWKPWDTVHRGAAAGYISREKFIDEGVDVLHFIANLLLTAGCTDEELSERFAAKQDKNLARQRTGYNGRGSDWDREHGET